MIRLAKLFSLFVLFSSMSLLLAQAVPTVGFDPDPPIYKAKTVSNDIAYADCPMLVEIRYTYYDAANGKQFETTSIEANGGAVFVPTGTSKQDYELKTKNIPATMYVKVEMIDNAGKILVTKTSKNFK